MTSKKRRVPMITYILIFLNQLLVVVIFTLDILNAIPEGFPSPPKISFLLLVFAVLFIVPLRSMGFTISYTIYRYFKDKRSSLDA